MLISYFYLVAELAAGVSGLACQQCNGWLGKYPPGKTTVATCDNMNNQCETTQYCVKIIDPMKPGTDYVTYKSDCFYATQLQVNPTNLTYVENNQCYPYQDGSSPVKRWYYCFCNDRDYCNFSGKILLYQSIYFVIFVYWFIFVL